MRRINISTISVFYFTILIILVGISVLHYKSGEPAAGIDDKNPSKYQYMILDEEDLLDDEEENALINDIDPVLYYGNVIISTVSTENYEQNCEDTYYKNFGNEPGVNFQIDMKNRKISLSASDNMENLIGKKRSTIVDNIYEYATDKKYYQCIKSCFEQIDKVINGERIAQKMKYICNGVIAVILGLIINFAVIFLSSCKEDGYYAFSGGKRLSVDRTSVNIRKGKLLRKKKVTSSEGSSYSGGRSGGGSGGGFSGGTSSHGF